MNTPQRVPALGTHPTSGARPDRAETRERLARATFDLLVVGGGILGTSVAWHAAQSGLRVAMVDAGDFAGATSSASSKGAPHGAVKLGAGVTRTRRCPVSVTASGGSSPGRGRRRRTRGRVRRTSGAWPSSATTR